MFSRIVKTIRYSVSLSFIKNDFNRNRDLIIHHGLMGNAKNFKNISKNNHISDYVNSYLVDARNHGESPHVNSNTIEQLAEDLKHFIQQHKLGKKACGRGLSIMGHSMGGMAVMKFSQRYPQLQQIIDRIIIIDINCVPKSSNVGMRNTRPMLAEMLKINLNQDTRKVFKQIQEKALTRDIAGLIKTNIRVEGQNKHRWIPNLEVLVRDFDTLLNFGIKANKWRKPVELIYGSKSTDVSKDQIQKYLQLYPQMKQSQNIHRIEAGHWVHFDNTSQFLKTMQKILKRDQ